MDSKTVQVISTGVSIVLLIEGVILLGMSIAGVKGNFEPLPFALLCIAIANGLTALRSKSEIKKLKSMR